jgi:tRNA modification GTPase
LKDAIVASFDIDKEDHEKSVMITNMRHKLALEKALAEITKAKESIVRGMSPEFAAFDLREALDCIDQITGKKINDEILDKIFSSFCIGK